MENKNQQVAKNNNAEERVTETGRNELTVEQEKAMHQNLMDAKKELDLLEAKKLIGQEEAKAEEVKRYVQKNITFKKGLKAPVQIIMHLDQKEGTYWMEVNGCQESSDMEIPNWDVPEFICPKCGSPLERHPDEIDRKKFVRTCRCEGSH